MWNFLGRLLAKGRVQLAKAFVQWQKQDTSIKQICGQGKSGVAGKRIIPIFRDADTLFQKGVHALNCGRYREAASLLQQATDLAAPSAEISLGLGIALMRLLKVAEAEAALEQAVTLDPNGFFPHFRLGELYLRIGVNTRAREELSRAMDLSTSVEQSEMVVRLLQIETQRSHRRSRP
jgi:tetratricopeptide (TPR) repeat protein